MKPPRLPGAEKFRFSDKKFVEQYNQSLRTTSAGVELDNCEQPNLKGQLSSIDDRRLSSPSGAITTSIGAAPSLSRQCSFASSRFDSSPELRRCDSNDSLASNETKTSEIYCALVEELAQLRLVHEAKRKPQLPISCRQLTSRLFTLSSLVHETSQSCSSSSTINTTKALSSKINVSSAQSFSYRRSSRVRQSKSMLDGALHLPVSSSDTETSAKAAAATALCTNQPPQSQPQSPVSSTLEQDVILACAPSRASLISVDDVQSTCTRTSDDLSSIRSGTSSPEMTTSTQHWAKEASLDLQTPRHRFSTSSQSSWDDDSLGT